jgi:heme-degrading monooxygenase HmoA
MVIILFRSRLTAAAGADYADLDAELAESVKSKLGFIEAKGFTAADGERLTVIWWQDRETLRLWREDLRHREAQTAGRKKWYQYYKMEVAEVFRQSQFNRTEKPEDSGVPVIAGENPGQGT